MKQEITIILDGPYLYGPFEGSEKTEQEYNHLRTYFTELTPPFQVLDITIEELSEQDTDGICESCNRELRKQELVEE